MMAEYNAFPVSLGHGDEVIAFDLGGTSFRSALLTRSGVLSHAQRIPSLNCRSLPGRSPDDIVHEIATYVADTVKGFRHASGSGDRRASIAISMGAALNAHTGKILVSGPILGRARISRSNPFFFRDSTENYCDHATLPSTLSRLRNDVHSFFRKRKLS